MAMNGTDVLLLVNVGTEAAPNYKVVGSQRGLTRVENTAEIDVSSKEERPKRVLGGRYDSTMTLDALYVPDDDCYLALQSANRNADLILVRKSEDDVQVEEATALITSMSESYPDQEAATITVSLRIDGEWEELGT